jgi:hypothetical protein
MAYTDQELAKMIAFISMLLSYMEVEWDSSADRIGNVENIASLFKAILEHVGQSPSLQSITFIWQCYTQGLLTMETQYFPDLDAQAPVHLALPLHCLPLSRVSMTTWNQHHHLIKPCFQSLVTLKKWIAANYSEEIHADLIATCEDANLLVEAVADFCATPACNGEEFLA